MNYDLKPIEERLNANVEYRNLRSEFRLKFPLSETFTIKADGIQCFLIDHAVSDGLTYGIMVDGVIVDGDHHLLELLGDQDRVAIEFRHTDWEPHGRADDAHQWLLRFGERE